VPRLGAHLSIAGGLPRAVDRARASKCEALQIFTKSAGQWRARTLPGDEMDEMYDQAVRIVAETRNASISYIQRRLKVGYNRAARMVEQMENEGVVGPQIGTKPREVFVSAIEP